MNARLLAVLALAVAASCLGQQPPVPVPSVAASEAMALRERAAAAANAGRHSDAADCYLQLHGGDQGRAEWVLAAARCLGLAGRYNDAINLLVQQRSRFPTLLEIPALLAKTHLLRVERDRSAMHPELDYDDAVRLCTEVLQADPDHEDARLILAQARYGQGDLDAAVAAAQEAVRRHPTRAGAHVLIGRIAHDRFTTLKQLATDTTTEPALRERLLPDVDEARSEAVAAFTRAAELDSDRAFARTMLGNIAVQDRDRDVALRHFASALAIDPLARVDHGWVTTATEPAARVEFYRAARDGYGKRGNASAAAGATLTFYEGLAHYSQGAWPVARALFTTAHADNPAYQNADYYAALCAWRLGDQDGAEALAAAYAAASAQGFADVLRALPPADRSEVADIVRYLGDRAFQQRRLDRSRDLNHVIACLLDSADAWNNHAFLCRESSQFDAAFASYQHALEKEPDSPQLWNDAAVILQYHLRSPEHTQKARQMYTHAIALADKVLADAASTAVARARAQQARADATRNLQALD